MRKQPDALATLLFAIALATPALAGCLGTAQATAMETESTAEDRASQWAQNPQLIAAIGVEGSFGGLSQWIDENASAEDWERAEQDPEVGDGYTELWMYRYVSEEKPDTVFTVIVDRNDEIIRTHREDRDADDEPIGAWEVDSDEAMDAARDANDGIREGASAEHYGLVMHLGESEDYENPVWSIVAGGGDSSGGGGGIVIVDAVTGEVLASHGGFSDWGSNWGNN